jgi:hypothetical protein
MEKKEFLENIQLAYTNALINIISKWVHDDDGANNHYQCQAKQVETYNNVMLIYQPGKQDDWIEDAFAIITPVKDCDYKITEELWKELTPMIDEVESRFVDSVNIFITKHNGWIEEVQNPTFDSIVKIINPLHYTSEKLIMKFTIGCYMSIPSMCWTPVSLAEWMFRLPSYQRYKKTEAEKFESEMKACYERMKSEIQMYEEEMEGALNQLHYISLQEKIDNLKICMNENEEAIKFKNEALYKLRKIEDEYNYSEEEYRLYGEEKGYHKVSKMVPYKKPFMIKLSLAGTKRCFSEIV